MSEDNRHCNFNTGLRRPQLRNTCLPSHSHGRRNPQRRLTAWIFLNDTTTQPDKTDKNKQSKHAASPLSANSNEAPEFRAIIVHRDDFSRATYYRAFIGEGAMLAARAVVRRDIAPTGTDLVCHYNWQPHSSLKLKTSISHISQTRDNLLRLRSWTRRCESRYRRSVTASNARAPASPPS